MAQPLTINQPLNFNLELTVTHVILPEGTRVLKFFSEQDWFWEVSAAGDGDPATSSAQYRFGPGGGDEKFPGMGITQQENLRGTEAERTLRLVGSIASQPIWLVATDVYVE